MSASNLLRSLFKNVELFAILIFLFFSEVQSVSFYDAHKGSHISISLHRRQEIPSTFRVCRLEGSISRVQTSGLHFRTHSSAATLCRPRNKVLQVYKNTWNVRSSISNSRARVSSGCPKTEKRVENKMYSRVFLMKFEVFG